MSQVNKPIGGKYVIRRGVLEADGTTWVFVDESGYRHCLAAVEVENPRQFVGVEMDWAINGVNGETGQPRPRQRRGSPRLRAAAQRNKRVRRESVRAVSAGLPTLGKR